MQLLHYCGMYNECNNLVEMKNSKIYFPLNLNFV